MSKKIVILFPGVNYHVDKPLLYFSRDIAAELGYEYINLSYGKMPHNIKGNEEKKREAFLLAKEEAEERLSTLDFTEYEKVVFISKSMGSLLATEYSEEHNLLAEHIIFTPMQELMDFYIGKGIVFHGTADSWIDTEDLKEKCKEERVKLYLIKNADHSLEVDNTMNNIEILKEVMGKVKEYLE